MSGRAVHVPWPLRETGETPRTPRRTPETPRCAPETPRCATDDEPLRYPREPLRRRKRPLESECSPVIPPRDRVSPRFHHASQDDMSICHKTPETSPHTHTLTGAGGGTLMTPRAGENPAGRVARVPSTVRGAKQGRWSPPGIRPLRIPVGSTGVTFDLPRWHTQRSGRCQNSREPHGERRLQPERRLFRLFRSFILRA